MKKQRTTVPIHALYGHGGFTLIEMLVVVAIVAILLGVVAVSPAIMSTNRRVTALQSVAAAIEAARSKAMRDQGTIYLAFTTNTAQRPLEACRQFAFFVEQTDASGNTTFSQDGAWMKLPVGVVFDQKKQATSGINLFDPNAGARKTAAVTLSPSVPLACLGFGSLGQVEYPADTVAGPFMISIAEGYFIDDLNTSATASSDPQPVIPNPNATLSLEVHRTSGKVFLLP